MQQNEELSKQNVALAEQNANYRLRIEKHDKKKYRKKHFLEH